MDQLKKFASGAQDKPSGANQQQANQQQANPAGQEDYLDKGLDYAEKRFGGGKIDAAKNRETNEKITDKARELFEKSTGKKIPDKFSN